MRRIIRGRVVQGSLMTAVALLCVSLLSLAPPAPAQSTNPAKQPATALLPADLFIIAPPANAVDVKLARQIAVQGSPIVLRGRIGGQSAPIADNRAIFLISDVQLPLCNPACGCPTPWDACCSPKETIISNLATVQVADQNGKPLGASLKGVNGLQPLAEVVVQGTVAKKDAGFLLVNAQYIYVKPEAQ